MTAQALSVYALWGATTLYAIAMVGYAVWLSGVVTAGGSATAPAKGRAFGIARAATVVGVLLNGVGVVARAVEAGHAPWSTMYEYTITGVFVAVGVFAIARLIRPLDFLGVGVLGFAAVALGIGMAALYEASNGIRPILDSYWIVIHVSIAILATGVFIVAAVATIFQLLRDHRESGSRALSGAWARGLDVLPGAAALEALAFRFNAVGFVLWTFTVMTGAMWAEHAWGRYWGWDPKEVWSFVIWVLYAAYLHARATRGWRGRRAAYLALAGFVALIANFTVVNLFFQGLHTYATP